jgi:thiamine pyrophosphate-dependent acetolactate synthase large subunit-like protein
VEWGVDTIFSLPGDGINGIFETLRTHQERTRYIQVRHEEAAAFAACGHAKYTGGLGVCMATPGPGGIHLLNGLYDAKCDGQPVLAITGHTFHDLIGTHYQQDVDLDKLFMDVAAYARACGAPGYTLEDPEQAEPVLRRALADPGPSLVEAVVDPNEPPLPGHATMEQAWHFAEALARGQKGGWDILKHVVKEKIREVV